MAKCKKCKTETIEVAVDLDAYVGTKIRVFSGEAQYCKKCDKLTYIKQKS